jgi:phosphatidyl-myo-inositol dimannoside synthase
MRLQEQGRNRLLFITRKWPPAVGGMEVYSHEMASEFDKICDTTVLALPGRATGQPPTILALVMFILKSAWYLLQRAKQYDAILLGDLVLAPLGVFARLSSRSVKTGVALHGSDVAYHLRDGILPKLYRCYLFLVAALQDSIDVVIANSEATGAKAEAISLHKICTIPLGVRLPLPVNDAEAGRYILFVGRIMPRKGAAWFAENVLPNLPADIRLLVAGTQWDDREVERLNLIENVELLGPVFGVELQQLRARALAVIVPNIPLGGRDFEGFGLVALEAAADGGIVLAADLDGLSSAVLDGKTGFLLPAENAEAWQGQIETIEQWTYEQRASFVRNARAHLASDFSWSATAERTVSAILAEEEAVLQLGDFDAH